MISPQSRVTLIDTPVAEPGVCVLCGSAGDKERKFVDFGKQLDWYGAIYFCTFCIAEVLTVCGFVPVASFDAIHNDLRNLQISNDNLVEQNRTLENALHNLLQQRIDPSSSSDSPAPSAVEGTDWITNALGEAAERDSETNESDSVEGPNNFHYTTE